MSGNCGRAVIPWNPFTTHARLDPESLARLITKTQNTEFLRTEESVILRNGTEDVIVVEFDVLLSTELLQQSVMLVQDHNQVALIINGAGIESQGGFECVKAQTTVSLPPKLLHLIVDTERASIGIHDVRVAIEQLEMLTAVGSVSLRDSRMEIEKLKIGVLVGDVEMDKLQGNIVECHLSLDSGNLNIHRSSFKSDHLESMIKVGNANISRGLCPDALQIRSQSGSINVSTKSQTATTLETGVGSIRFDVLVDDAKTEDSSLADCSWTFVERASTKSSTIELSCANGDIDVQRGADYNRLRLLATVKVGSIRIRTAAEVPTQLSFEAEVGSVIVSESVHITRQQKTFTGMALEGYTGIHPAQLEIKAHSKIGSIAYVDS